MRILYLGDTSIDTAAAYLAGLMTRWHWSFEYLNSDTSLSLEVVDAKFDLLIVSDYPAARMQDAVQQRVLQQVADGAGLLMVGGWESYQGSGGGWAGTPLAEALPVVISTEDDRMNCDHCVFAQPAVEHVITTRLPWDKRPPLIGGYNQFQPKPFAEVLLNGHHVHAKAEAGRFSFETGDVTPLLVAGLYGAGRTAALATDVAPHWIGPMVDWGETRVTAQAPGADEVEVGSAYAQFLHQLLAWTGKIAEA